MRGWKNIFHANGKQKKAGEAILISDKVKKERLKVKSLSCVQVFVTNGLQPTRFLHPWVFPGKNTGVGCHFLLQEIFSTQGLNPGLPHCRQTLYRLSHQGIHLKIKNITRDNEGHYIMIKGSIQEEDITIINIYSPNIGAPQYIRQTLTDIKGENGSNTIIVGDFNTPLTPMDRSPKQKINKETQVLNDILDEMDLINIFRTFHPNAGEYTFFSSAHGTFSRIDHIFNYKSNIS